MSREAGNIDLGQIIVGFEFKAKGLALFLWAIRTH